MLLLLLPYANGNRKPRLYNLRNEIYLDRDKVLNLKWDLDYKTKIVYFRLHANFGPEKWFGFGFSDYGESTNADLIVFWTDPLSIHHFQDTWSDSRGLLHIDSRQDYTVVKATVRPMETDIILYRKFDTCDEHDYQLDNGTTHIIFFISDGQPTHVDSMNITALNPGIQRVQLLKPELKKPNFPDDTWTFDVIAPKVHIPSKETTYWWYITTIPELRKKHHIIKFEGLIQNGNENLVHHMEVFHCEVGEKNTVPPYNGPGMAEGKPPELEACRNVIGAWAMGAQPLVLPEEAGTPIGSDQISRFVLLEVHYNNPGLKSGIIDSSGIRFYVTSQLRKYDAGIMELGLEYTDKMAIPPHQEKFLFEGFCIKECTEIGLPDHGIKIFASQLHSHLTGRRVYTKHVREGVELPELNRDNHYSPHFQEIRLLQAPVEIMPGDSLITTCEDTTLDRQNMTFGGFSIRDEMCVNYVHYYPRVELEVCKSSIATQDLKNYFKFMHGWDGAATSRDQGIQDNYNAIDWTPLNVHLLKTLYDSSPLSMQCNQSDGRRFPGNWEGASQPRIRVPLPKVARSCPFHTNIPL
ncbi:hypothetical protein ScPMuIL_010409 [Solemya velum]